MAIANPAAVPAHMSGKTAAKRDGAATTATIAHKITNGEVAQFVTLVSATDDVLVLGADVIDAATVEQILATFLRHAPRGDRYADRRERLAKLDISKL